MKTFVWDGSVGDGELVGVYLCWCVEVKGQVSSVCGRHAYGSRPDHNRSRSSEDRHI
jgi:hypothetical protein